MEATAIGRRLVPLLVANGHDVVATTRSREKARLLRELGAEAVILDGLDGAAVGEAVALAKPQAVVSRFVPQSYTGWPTCPRAAR